MRKYLTLIGVLLVIILAMTSCKGLAAKIGDNEKGITKNVDAPRNADARFYIDVDTAKIINENGRKNIVYSFTVYNRSEEAYKDFIVTIALNKKLDQYIAAGITPLPFTKIDLAAKSQTPKGDEGKGVEVNFEQILSDEQFMREAGLKYEDILDLGRNFEVQLKWDGGEENHLLSTVVIDESK